MLLAIGSDMHTPRNSWKPFQCHDFIIKANENCESLQLIRTTVSKAIRHTLLQGILIRIVAPELKGGGPRYKGSDCEEVYVDLSGQENRYGYKSDGRK